MINTNGYVIKNDIIPFNTISSIDHNGITFANIKQINNIDSIEFASWIVNGSYEYWRNKKNAKITTKANLPPIPDAETVNEAMMIFLINITNSQK